MHPKDAATASNEAILREILDSITALKNGHFTTHLCDNLPGIGGQIAAALNEHLRMLQDLRREHHRLAEEINVTGRLGGQMEVEGAAGAWKEMVDEMNRMGGNVTAQFRDGGNIVRALLRGESGARMTAQFIQGEFRDFREQVNELADRFEERSPVGEAVG
jgi:hypothetical protein